MTAWISAYAMSDHLPNPDTLVVHTTREAAIENLKEEMHAFAQDQDDFSEDGSCEAHWGAIWAFDGSATPQVAAGGEVHLTLDDSGDFAWKFWVVPSPEKWFNFVGEDDEPRTAENALEVWIETFEPENDDEVERLMEFTRFDVLGSRGIAGAATYHGIDLDARNYPLPKEI